MASHSRPATGERAADKQEAVFMQAALVPPYCPPISTELAQATVPEKV